MSDTPSTPDHSARPASETHGRVPAPGAVLDELDRDGLRDLTRSLLWLLRCTDAFWFLDVEQAHGLAAAEAANDAVWAKMGRMAARDIVQRFGPFPPGVDGFLAAYRYFPWNILSPFDLERTAPDELRLTMAQCPPQVARRRHGQPPYRCKHMHLGELAAFCAVIDPALHVACSYAPPDPHPDDHFCRFTITLRPDAETE